MRAAAAHIVVVFFFASVDARAEDDFYALRDGYDGTRPDILAFFFFGAVCVRVTPPAHFNSREDG